MSLLLDPENTPSLHTSSTDINSKQHTTQKVSVKRKRHYGVEISVLGPGEYFGHTACLHQEGKIPFSVITNEVTELLVISKKDFHKLFFTEFQERLLQNSYFLCAFPSVSYWLPSQLGMLALYMTERHFSLDECLFRQGELLKSLYFIRKGEVKLSLCQEKAVPKEVRDRINPPWDFLSEILAEGTDKSSRSTSRSWHQLGSSRSALSTSRVSLTSVTSTGPTASRRRVLSEANAAACPLGSRYRHHEPDPRKCVQICTLTSGEILGSMERLCGLKHYLFNAMCSSTVEVLELNLVHFLKMVERKHPRAIEKMLQNCIELLQEWETRLPPVSLFPPLLTILKQHLTTLGKEGKLRSDRGSRMRYESCELPQVVVRAVTGAKSPLPHCDTC